MRILKRLGIVGVVLTSALSFAMIGQSVVSAATVSSTNFELAYVDQSGNVYLKSGNISAPFIKIWDTSDPASSVQVSHGGIVIIDQSGVLFANTLPIVTTWTAITTNATPQNVAISDTGIVFLSNSTLYIKFLAQLSYSWDSFFGNVQSFKMSANGNIAAIGNDGTLYEAYGGYGALWRPVATNFNGYGVSNNSIGVIFGNELYMMIGTPVNNVWLPTNSNAASVQLSSNGNIGVTDLSGNLDVALGGYGSLWTNNVRSSSDSTSTFVSDTVVTLSLIHI